MNVYKIIFIDDNNKEDYILTGGINMMTAIQKIFDNYGEDTIILSTTLIRWKYNSISTERGVGYEKEVFKGDVILICENGEPTNLSTNIDRDIELDIGDIFNWQPNKK